MIEQSILDLDYEAITRHARRLESVRDLKTLLRSTWNWKIFGSHGARCFGETRIEPTDIDMIIERNGFLLLMETKLSQKPAIDGGQLILFKSLLWTTPSTLFFINGEPEEEKITKIEAWRRGVAVECPARFKLEPSMESWFEATRQWFIWANSMRSPRYLGPIWSFDRKLRCARLDIENAIPLEQERYASIQQKIF